MPASQTKNWVRKEKRIPSHLSPILPSVLSKAGAGVWGKRGRQSAGHSSQRNNYSQRLEFIQITELCSSTSGITLRKRQYSNSALQVGDITQDCSKKQHIGNPKEKHKNKYTRRIRSSGTPIYSKH